MMLGHMAANGRKGASKFEDSSSDSSMPRPRAASEVPQRPAPRLKAAAGSESTGGAPRRPVVVRGTTAPRSPLHEKKPPVGGGGAGAGSRVVELEAKLEKAHGQLTEMREQLTAAEKARKEARAALVEAKKRLAAKKRDDLGAAASAVQGGDGHNKALAAVAAAVGYDEKAGMIASDTDVLDAVVSSEPENNNVEPKAKNTTGREVVDNVMSTDDEKMWRQEVDELSAKLMAKDREVYELRTKLTMRDTEADELRETLTAKNIELDELERKLASTDAEINKLTASLTAKDADIAALEADNAELTKMAEEAGEAVEATAARARETEHALRDSAAREARVAELLRASERAREALEAEAQRSRVQSEQWRKAAEEAAVVLGVVDRGGAPGTPLVDKRFGSGLWTAKGAEEDGATGKRKPGAIRALSDLWKKKAQK